MTSNTKRISNLAWSAYADSEGAFVSIRIATSKAFTELKPVFEVFCDSRVAWLDALEGTMVFPRMPSG